VVPVATAAPTAPRATTEEPQPHGGGEQLHRRRGGEGGAGPPLTAAVEQNSPAATASASWRFTWPMTKTEMSGPRRGRSQRRNQAVEAGKRDTRALDVPHQQDGDSTGRQQIQRGLEDVRAERAPGEGVRDERQHDDGLVDELVARGEPCGAAKYGLAGEHSLRGEEVDVRRQPDLGGAQQRDGDEVGQPEEHARGERGADGSAVRAR